MGVSAFEFEGDEIVDFLGVLPKAVLECPEAYIRGTQLDLNVTVRVKSVRLEEDKQGNLIRQHIFAIEAVSIKDKIDPQKAIEGAVTGSASSSEAELSAEPIEFALNEALLDTEPVV